MCTLSVVRVVADAKEPEIQIGAPTDVKHVAHIGWDSASVTNPTWVSKRARAPLLRSDPIAPEPWRSISILTAPADWCTFADERVQGSAGSVGKRRARGRGGGAAVAAWSGQGGAGGEAAADEREGVGGQRCEAAGRPRRVAAAGEDRGGGGGMRGGGLGGGGAEAAAEESEDLLGAVQVVLRRSRFVGTVGRRRGGGLRKQVLIGRTRAAPPASTSRGFA